MFSTLILLLRCILGLAILSSACGGAGIEVRNQSAVRLDDVVISANGKSARIASIDSQTVGKTSICPAGEAGKVDLSFRAEDRLHSSEHALYFECDALYVIRLEVSPAFRVRATATLR
jgi:hypothetical protein